MTARLASISATALFLAVGCVVRTVDNRPTSDPGDTTRSPRSSVERWEKLGEGTANGRNDRDVVQVGRSEGRFRAIRLKVERSSVRMQDIVVHFTDGTRFSPNTAI